MTSTEIREKIEVLHVKRSRVESDLSQADAVVVQSLDKIVSDGSPQVVDSAALAQSRRNVLSETLADVDQQIETLRAQLPTVEAEERRAADFAEMAHIAEEATAHLEELERSRKALNDALTKHAALLVKHRAALVEKRAGFIGIANRHARLQYSAIRMPSSEEETALSNLVAGLEETGADLSAVLFPWNGRTEIDRHFELAELEYSDVIGGLMYRGPNGMVHQGEVAA